MRLGLLALLLTLFAASVSSSARAEEAKAEGAKVDAELTAKIKDALADLKKIKPGMTRADLLNVLTTEGGFSTRTRRRYVYAKCPYIKVDVEFEKVGEEERFGESSKDKVTSVSQPFLELSIGD